MMVPRPCLMMISARTPIDPVSSTARMIGVEFGFASESHDSRYLRWAGSSSGASPVWVKICDRDLARATFACACQSASDHRAFPIGDLLFGDSAGGPPGFVRTPASDAVVRFGLAVKRSTVVPRPPMGPGPADDRPED